MIKPKRLKSGNRVAIVSLSWGGLGDPEFLHKFWIAKERLESDYGLEVVVMPHALKGSEFVFNHPELRAKDFMDALRDDTIDAIFSAIGGDDSIRMLPYIDLNVIRSNPKIFMGYSDTTVTHLMMFKAGVVSFYGPSIMCEFGEYVSMFEYTETAVKKVLFEDTSDFQIHSSPVWSKDFVAWQEENRNIRKELIPELHGYEILQGSGKVQGHLLGGCLDVFPICIGTSIWATLEEWKGAILFFETSEEKPSPDFVRWTLMNLAAQGILGVINGIIVGKPQDEVHYEAYKDAILNVVLTQEKLNDLPILYNVNFGHAYPNGILPYGIQTEIDCNKKTLILKESATV